MENSMFRIRLASLKQHQLKEVCTRLLLYLELESEREPALTEKDVEIRRKDDLKLLEKVFAPAKISYLEVSEDLTQQVQSLAVNFLVQIADIFPEYRSVIAEYMDELENDSVTLNLSNEILNASIILSIAAAIIRPRIIIKEKYNETGYEKEIDFQFQGINDIAKLLKDFFDK